MEMGKLVPQTLRHFDIEWASDTPEWRVETFELRICWLICIGMLIEQPTNRKDKYLSRRSATLLVASVT